MRRMSFPPGFVWGAATSAYQIEGATTAGGRGESIWDRFSNSPGKVLGGDTGASACEHYQRWREDVALMRDLGLRAYRFSIAWPRVIPRGVGEVNQPGLDFYSRLVDALLEAEITPFATLYHWDLPQALEDAGGWPERGTAVAFADYADAVTRRLGDRVTHWITHNEPWCASMLGYRDGAHAPGREDGAAALAASHHLLLSHGWAVAVARANQPDCQIGIALNLVPAEPASPSAADAAACRTYDACFNRWFLDPLFGRGYPAEAISEHVRTGSLQGMDMEFVNAGDLAAIAAPTDFLGINYYNRAVTRSEVVPEAENLPRTEHVAPESERTDIGWEVYPDGLCHLLEQVHRRYQPPAIYVTENGAAYGTQPGLDHRVRDVSRGQFLRDHIQATWRAVDAGVPVAGYFVWSLLDNFEWAAGYSQRFGIVWVDYKTQQRIPKDSAWWYRDVITRNGLRRTDARRPAPASAARKAVTTLLCALCAAGLALALLGLTACSTAASTTDGGAVSPVPDSGPAGSDTGNPSTDGARILTFANACDETIWVGALNAAPEYELPHAGGWKLEPAESRTIALPTQWGGRFWGRTGCDFASPGPVRCETGDCDGRQECGGIGGKTPATLAEFTFAGYAGLDFYDVSLVDGYNLPLQISPVAGTYVQNDPGDPLDCGSPSCTSDLNDSCPAELQYVNTDGQVVGCLSACEQFQTDEYCCRGDHDTPDTCPPFGYSATFKAACPTAYSYAYDDETSTFTCRGEDYIITFCQ